MVAPPPEKYVAPPPALPEPIAEMATEDNAYRGRMLYAYAGTGNDELAVEQGRDVTIVEPDG